MRKSAFTLIELLVVIAIIAILAGIALPVFNKVLERGRATNCASNLRQIGIGVAAFLNDNDDQMFSKKGAVGDATWPVTLQSKYITNWKAFRSPFDKVTAARPDTQTLPVPVSYGINGNVFDVNASKFSSPSLLILMAPALQADKTNLVFTGTSATNVELTTPQSASTDKLGTHSNRAQINALYADTHVANVQYLTEFAKIDGDEGPKRWYPEGTAP